MTNYYLNSIDAINRSLDVFGYVRLKNLFDKRSVSNCFDIMNNHYEGSVVTDKVIEKFECLQKLVFSDRNGILLNDIIGDAWYHGSDISVRHGHYTLHRDALSNIPIYKLFIPLVSEKKEEYEGVFHLLPGSHNSTDTFTRSSAALYSLWNNKSYKNTSSTVDCNLLDKSKQPYIHENGENLLHIKFTPGDALLFNTSLVHGVTVLKNEDFSMNTFIAASFYPGPSLHTKFGKTYLEHEVQIAAQRIAGHTLEAYRFTEPYKDYYFESDTLKSLKEKETWKSSFQFDTLNLLCNQIYDKVVIKSRSIVLDGEVIHPDIIY